MSSSATILLTLAVATCSAVAWADDASRPAQVPKDPTHSSAVRFYRNPGSRAPFSLVVRVENVLYVSGQIGMEPGGKLPADFAGQAKAAMDNIATALASAGSTLESVFKCTIMLDDMSNWDAFNKVYVSYFKPDRLPARSAFGVRGLALGSSIEVECLAYAPVP